MYAFSSILTTTKNQGDDDDVKMDDSFHVLYIFFGI